MRLKRLDLYGFKSFAARSTFEFGEGITAIVGPNGSGKSNIADAIRWVLGEQNYRSLRAKTTEDMIFAGSRNRPRQGMAEVLITLDNAEGWLPLEFSEVTIGRRAYRSGENEYLLNGNRVRYHDIVETLGGGGLLRSSYLVIGQGMVDAALSLRPEARRTLFEEAAGIAPHLRKRSEALKRIEETEHNLERVGDILAELQPRLASLHRQAERAQEYLLLSQDLKELQRIWYGYQWQRWRKRFVEVLDRIKEQESRLNTQRDRVHELQEKLGQCATEQDHQRQVIDDLSAKQSALREEDTMWRRELAIVSERARLYRQQQQALRQEIDSLSRRCAIVQQEIDKAAAEIMTHEATYAASRVELETVRQELGGLDAARSEWEKRIAKGQSDLDRQTAQLSELRARMEQGAERRAALDEERRELAVRLAELDEWLGKRQDAIRELNAREEAIGQARLELQRRYDTTESQILASREQLAADDKEIAKVQGERDRLVSRHEALVRLHQELAGYHPGVREVLSREANLTGLLGTVANLMGVPQQLEQAIESALGARLQNIVAERWEDAEAAISHLKAKRGGWATFLPLDTIRVRPPLTCRPEPGVVGVASALVHFDERLRPVFELLLGSIIIVRDLPTARRLLERRTGASLLVTLEGETVQPSGALSGGSRRESGNLLAQERERRDLPERIRRTEEELDKKIDGRSAHEAEMASLRQQLADLDRQLAQSRSDQEGARNATDRQTRELRDLERERTWRLSRLAQTQKEIEASGEREGRLREQVAAAQREQAASVEALRQLREQYSLAAHDALRQRAAEAETRVAVAERTVSSQRALLSSHRNNLAQLAKQVADKQAQCDGLDQELAKLVDSQVQLENRLAELTKQAEDVRGEMEPARQRLAQAVQQRRNLEAQVSSGVGKQNELQLDLERAILERDHVREEQQTLAHEIESELGPIDLPDAVSHQLRLNLKESTIALPTVESLPGGLSSELTQLKARLRRMGNINPEAPREYQELLDRQAFLQGQTEDLHNALAALRRVIEELDKVIEHDFRTTFRRVDEAFRVHFELLFGGGSAHLFLTDPDNLSTSGVDITAQPPGKRAQNLALLSGGERALTAVALLFALLNADPVPFCFLDEVDAALDEANVGRFRSLLEETALETQFVVITHNRNTIEAATTIYGISMGEQGVSQSISLKLPSRNGARTQEATGAGVA